MTATPPTPPTPEAIRAEVSLREVVAIFFRRFTGMAIIFSMAMLMALVWIFAVRAEVYESTAKILVRMGYEQAPSVTVMGRQTPVVGYRYQDVATEVHILSSTDVLERVVDQLNLEDMGKRPRPQGFLASLVYGFRQALAKVGEWFDEALIRVGLRERLTPRQQIIDALSRGLLVGSSQESNVLVAVLRLPYREGTAAVLDAILDSYLEARVTFFQEKAAVNLFRTKMKQTLEALRELETELKQLESDSNIVNLGVQEQLLLEREKQLEAQLKADTLELRALKGKLDTLKAVRNSDEISFGSLGAFPQGSFAANLMTELARIKNERISLEMAAGGRDQRTVNENKRRFEVTLDLLESNIESTLAEQGSILNGRKAALLDVRTELAALHGHKTAWRDLLRRSELLETDYKFYRHQVEAASATSSMQTERISNVKIIQHPMDPVRPAGIRKLYLIHIAAVLSAFVAIAWASMAEFFDHRVYSTSQVANHLGVPVAGVVPRPSFTRSGGGLNVKHSPKVGFSQTSAFVARHAKRHGLRHFLFTSARVGEGTTTTVLGVSRELQVSYGMRVLAMEINPGSGGFKAKLKLDGPPFEFVGGSSLSAKDVTRAPAGFGLLSVSGKENGRDTGSDSVNLLGHVLESLVEDFTVILVDAPPVLERPEALAMAPEVDGVVLVVEAGRTRLEMLSHVRSLFNREDVKLLGSVLTKQKHAIPSWLYRRMFK